MRYLIKNGTVIDPANNIEEVSDVLIADGKIEKIGKGLDDRSCKVVDASGKIVAPGLCDMHTHLREPGREDEETVRTGTRSAIRGGFTSVCCMPNTDPAIDSPETVKAVNRIITKDAVCSVYIVGAITKGRGGKKVNNFKAMKRSGIVAVSDDGSSVQNAKVLKEALKEAKKNSLVLIEHCEDPALSAGGVMNKGFISTKRGLRGISKESEYRIVERDISLAAKEGAHIHIAHVSCAESVELIRKAKREGVPVTAETAPHYFALTEDCCATYDTNTKMNPPLRTQADAEAIKKGLSDGTIDAIATDHAPHTDSEKDVEFDFAPFGIIGLETALSVAIMELVEKKILSWSGLVRKMSVAPAEILGVAKGTLSVNACADIIIIDPGKEYIYKKESIESKSKNSPFINWQLKGAPVDVFAGGALVMRSGLLTGT